MSKILPLVPYLAAYLNLIKCFSFIQRTPPAPHELGFPWHAPSKNPHVTASFYQRSWLLYFTYFPDSFICIFNLMTNLYRENFPILENHVISCNPDSPTHNGNALSLICLCTTFQSNHLMIHLPTSLFLQSSLLLLSILVLHKDNILINELQFPLLPYTLCVCLPPAMFSSVSCPK